MIIRFIKTGLALIVSLFVLCAFVLVWGFSGIHVTNPDGFTDYKWESNQLKTTMTEGFSWFRMDDNGFNNQNISENPDVLLMGSSHMEAISVKPQENVGALLSENYNVYNIGMSGHTIYHCVKNYRNAVEYFNPDIVIIEIDRVLLDTEKMLQVVEGKYPTIPSYDSGAVYYIQRYLPAVKTIFKNLQDWKTGTASQVKVLEGTNSELSMDYQTVLERFISLLHPIEGKKVILVYQPTTKIDEDGKILNETDSFALESMKDVCEKNDVIFLDMTEPFAELYENEHVLAHGFINTGVGTGHLNKYGHKAIAKALNQVIMKTR